MEFFFGFEGQFGAADGKNWGLGAAFAICR